MNFFMNALLFFQTMLVAGQMMNAWSLPWIILWAPVLAFLGMRVIPIPEISLRVSKKYSGGGAVREFIFEAIPAMEKHNAGIRVNATTGELRSGGFGFTIRVQLEYPGKKPLFGFRKVCCMESKEPYATKEQAEFEMKKAIEAFNGLIGIAAAATGGTFRAVETKEFRSE